MIPFSSIISNQIRFLLQSINDSNFDSVLQELFQFTQYGSEGSILLLQTCLDNMNFHSGDVHNMQLKPDLLAAIFRYLLEMPNFSTVFCESLRSFVISEGFLRELCNALHFSVAEKIGIGLALAESENLDVRTTGQNFCLGQIEELCACPTTLGSVERIQDIILFLYRSEGLARYVDSFMQMLSLLDPKQSRPVVLAPLLPEDLREDRLSRNLDLFYGCGENEFNEILAEIENETSMADVVKELGYGLTFNATHCKEVLSLFLPLTEATLSRVISTIARTRTGLDDSQSLYSTFCSAIGSIQMADSSNLSSWNVDVLVDTIKQLAPGINWVHVMETLDHEGFYIPNEDAFTFFMSIYACACQDPFPLHAICGSVWKNVDGQLSFLRYAISAPPEVFTFAHSVRQMAYSDVLRGFELPQGLGNHAWLSLDLLEVLCKLAERGHAGSVREILTVPLKHSPEVLLLGIAQINTAYNLLQCEVSSTVFPMIVGNATGGGMLLNLWDINPKLVLHGFVDMIKIDQNNMVRIMDICEEIKILSAVLEQIPFPFSIRLAALASQKECINLEKWLNENLSTYKDIFFEDCLKVLKDISFDSTEDVAASPFQHSGSVVNLYAETSPTFLKVLQANAEELASDHLTEELKRLQRASLHVSPRLQNVGAADSSASDGYSDDIESEANSYFHQIFSSQVTIEAMIQMLARFKDSSDPREKAIFDCMIQNLFEEYRFFPRYPEKQLKIAAILLGSLIKHQLVTHLTLGIALRGVLDALRKPTDSKIFAFGTKALEQFLDRLVEWPQYCNHILQISHLRGSHPELVAFIERALARISSGHSDSNGGASSSIDAQHGSAQATLDNAEVPDSSWQLLGPRSTQPSQLLSSPLQMQQRNQGLLGDKQSMYTAPLSYPKPLLTPGQTSSVPSGDLGSSQKPAAVQSIQTATSQNSGTVSSTVSSSSGFLHSNSRINSASVLRQHSYNTGFGSALNIETLVAAAERRDTPVEVPSSEIQDKILFMINNISTSNIDAKAKEFNEILSEQYYPWFAQYMVMKRASIEPNFHDLYLKFLDKVNSKALNKEIVKAAYENCKVLLRSELIKSSSEERSLLKNLGSWLGKFTIGRNQVLRAREIDPKSLIIEAYEKGLMIAVIPFTSKVILEPCQGSLAYRPPNPWTMAILGLLVEIYQLPNLKMNLKFDIEVLFKNLGVDMKEVKPTSLLKDRVREVEGNPDFSNKDVASQPQMVSEINSGIMSTLNQVELQPDIISSSHPGGHLNVLSQYTTGLHLASVPLMEDEKIASLGLSERLPSGQGLPQVAPSQSPYSVGQLQAPIPNIGSHIIFNQKLSALGMHYFQRVVPIAMERAIKEVMSPIVQRSVAIAIQTTKELVLKDYAMESDETRIYNAAHLMVASLAGSLAHVTCKEPLRVSISSQLRNSLQGLNMANELLEQAVPLVMNDNLDLGCAAIEHAATEKALQTIDNEIAQQLVLRRKHRERVGPSYYDASIYTQGPMGVIPEALRPRPGQVAHGQHRVYEDFVRFPWQNQPGQSSNAASAGSPASSTGPVSSGLSRAYTSSTGQLNTSFYSSGLASSGLSAATQPLDLVSEELDPSSPQLLSSSTRVGGIDSVSPHGGKLNSITPFTSTTAAPEVDATNAVKELGTTALTLPATSTMEHLGSNIVEPLTTGDVLEKYQIIAQKLETLITRDAGEVEIPGVIAQIPEIILKCISRDEAALAVAQKVFKSLYENTSNNLHVSVHLTILAAIRDVCKLVVKELTSWVIYSDEERKFNTEIIVGLIRKDLLNLAEYNMHMAKLIDAGRNKAATEFAVSLLQTLLVQESRVSVSELPNLVDALAKLATRPGSPESLQQLVEIARNPTANAAVLSGFSVGKEDRTKQARDKKGLDRSFTIREDHASLEPAGTDPAGFRDQVSMLFAEWYRMSELHGTNDAACTHFIAQLQQNGFLNGDDVSERFFRLLTELSVAHCAEGTGSLSLQSSQISFAAVDVYAKLVVLILKILTITVKVIQRDAEEKKMSFNPKPYFRMFINWLFDLLSPDPILDGANSQVLVAFANAFHLLQPLKVPAFSFAWLELVSHRSFMPKLLTINPPKGWSLVQRLLVDLFKFMEPYLRNAELGEPILVLYKGTLRVLLVLLHDFPEFLCDYHFSFCDVIPSSCIQMRNVILSAFPRNMRLPDPSTPNLKIDLLAEINQSPQIFSEVDAALKAKQMKSDVDEYLKTRHHGSPFLSELKQRLMLPQNEAAQAGTRYNVPLINSLVIYVGMQTVQQLQTKSPAIAQQMAHNSPMELYLMAPAIDIFQTLIVDLDTEGRYLFLNAIANQLRYPNNHTHFFSFVLLYLFVEANQNPRYNFWNRSFTRCAPEIEKLFESVSRSCGGPKPVDESLVSGGISDNMH
ncbi:CCR4-NOT transcription complex subunit 1, HEAT repeat [Dillenia turbinata]|uniref:CCR4-NOT transcription complex subunit 1, HEAT repeat n=1 Tax=Dillenia turbinata TaxID=194707 RepID=A0AAN8ZJF6_9MAGN